MSRARCVSDRQVSVATRAWTSRGQARITVVVKATFVMGAGGALVVATEPDPIREHDAFHDENPTRSLADTTDLVPYLRRGEVLFRGPGLGPPGSRVRARLAVMRGSEVLIDKSLALAMPATGRLPITYENAQGGPGQARNPVGRAEAPILDPRAEAIPIGLGPLSRSWHARAHLVSAAQRQGLQGAELRLDDDMPWDYFHAAPPDQRIAGFFSGRETIVLERLGSHGTLELRLPGARAEARLVRAGAVPEPLPLVADMLRIDGDRGRVSLTWRGHAPVANDERLVVIAGMGLPNAAIVWPELDFEPQETASATQETSDDLNATAGPHVGRLSAPTLPFAAVSPSTPLRAPARGAVPWREQAPRSVPAPEPGLAQTLSTAPEARPQPVSVAPAMPARIAQPPATPIAAAPPPAADAHGLAARLRRAGAHADDIALLVGALGGRPR
jgi:hypothetical protein